MRGLEDEENIQKLSQPVGDGPDRSDVPPTPEELGDVSKESAASDFGGEVAEFEFLEGTGIYASRDIELALEMLRGFDQVNSAKPLYLDNWGGVWYASAAPFTEEEIHPR